MSLTNVCYGFRSVATRRIVEPRLNRSDSGLSQLRHEAGICFMTQSRRVNKKHPHYYEASDGSMPEDYTLSRFHRRSFHKSTSRRKKKNSCEVEDANENFLNLADYETFLAESAVRNRTRHMDESAEECNILKTILEVQPDGEPQSINALEILKEKAQEPILISSRAWDEGEMIRFIDKVRSKLEMRRNKGIGEKIDSKVSQTLTNKIQYFNQKTPSAAGDKLSPLPVATEPVVVAPVITKLEAGIQCNRAANDKMTQASADREVQTDNKREVGTETSSSSRELPSTDSVLNFKPRPVQEWTPSSSSDEDPLWRNKQKKIKKIDPTSSSTGSFLAYMLQTKKEASEEMRKRPISNEAPPLEKLDHILLQRRKSPKPNREVPDEIAAKLLRTESRRPPRRARCSPPPEKQPFPKKERPRIKASLSSIDWMKQFKGNKKKKPKKGSAKIKSEEQTNNVALEVNIKRRPKVLPSKISRQTCHSREYCSASSGQESPRFSPKKKRKSKKVLVHEEHCPLYHSRRKKTSLTHAKVKAASSSPMESNNLRKNQNPRPKSTPIKKMETPTPVNNKKTNVVGFLGRVAWFRDRLSEMIS